MSATPVSGFNSKSHDARITGLKGTNSARCKSITKNMIGKDTLGNTFKVPDFTIKDILSAIPKKCYMRCWYKGMLYIFRDFCCCFLFGIVARNIIPLIPIKFIRGLAWVFYSFCISLPYTGFWVMAHECVVIKHFLLMVGLMTRQVGFFIRIFSFHTSPGNTLMESIIRPQVI